MRELFFMGLGLAFLSLIFLSFIVDYHAGQKNEATLEVSRKKLWLYLSFFLESMSFIYF